jgi:hypothetical protein
MSGNHLMVASTKPKGRKANVLGAVNLLPCTALVLRGHRASVLEAIRIRKSLAEHLHQPIACQRYRRFVQA